MNSTFKNPHEFRVNEMIQANDELWVILNSELDTNHFAFKVAGLKWDFTTGRFESKITRFILVGWKAFRTMDAKTRVMYGLNERPYDAKAFQKAHYYQNDRNHFPVFTPDWHNDRQHNLLP
jgi:hypothetical protein